MALEHAKFEVSRLNDKSVVEAVQAALANNFQCVKCSFQSIFGGGNLEGLPGQTPQVDQLLAENTTSILQFTFSLNDGSRITVKRDWNPNEHQLSGYCDTVTIQPAKDNQSLSSYANLLKSLKTYLRAIDDRAFLDYLKDEDRTYYEARERSLQKLQLMQEDFFKKLQDFTVQQAEFYDKKQLALEEKYSAKESQLNEINSKRVSEIDEKEADLKRRAKELDDRTSTHARREIQKDFKKLFGDRSQKFELTEGAKQRRRFVFWGYVGLLVLLGGTAGFMLLSVPHVDNTTGILYLVRQILFSLGFIVTAGFFLRWMNTWAQTHADEEFKLKRLELDIDRASWVVEHALEWKAEKGSEIPDKLLDRLSKNLFSDETSDENGMTAADSLALAILRSSAKAKLKVGDAEFELGHQGVKKLDKTRIE